MGWLSRLFPEAQISEAPGTRQEVTVRREVTLATGSQPEIPPAKVGLDGEFDESGLAKRVALAFDADPELGDVDTLWIAQRGGRVVLNGRVPSQQILDRMISVATRLSGTTEVDASQVTVG
ncbi:MAG: BON domain-containing protein [Elainella sp.]